VEHLKQLALDTERALRPDAVQLREAVGAVGKALLVRDARQPFAAHGLALLACTSDEQWSQYEDYRIPVEASFGLDEAAARDLVRLTRERTGPLGLRLWLATGQEGVVGGIGAFAVQGEGVSAARLQEVDVFPAHRGQGLGGALLEGVRRLLLSEGFRMLVVGADEDDWPLAWYRRLGFRQVLRVRKPVP
jgi:GNAT superfamily N-acetyltransferase